MEKRVAFFDIDGTVFRSSLLVELIEHLIEAEVFPIAARAEYLQSYTAWLNREGTYETYIDTIVKTFYKHIKGVQYSDFIKVGQLVVDAQSKQVYRYTRDLIIKLKKQNYYVVAISQSPKGILDPFCESHGFDKVYGRLYELGPDDTFTGEVIDLHLIENKANIIKRVLENEEFTKDGSVAVGDTEGDITMFDSVSQPICFNPNKALYMHAQRMGWKVVIERKDMIYEL